MKPPLPHSYWVEPGRFAAGEHPAGADVAATRARLAQLREAGVRAFLDLTEPGERPDYRHLLPPDTRYENQPLPDHSVPRTADHMRRILAVLDELLDHGAVYVHCRAGIGRTGTTVGCFLRARGAAPRAALDELNRLWRQNARAVHWPTVPETEEQEAFVLSWEPQSQGDLSPVAQGGAQAGAHAPVSAAPLQQRFRGCLLGLAVGDIAATAAPDTGAQAWTDDTGTALCVAESLLARQGFDGRDQLERFRAWERDPPAAGAAAGAALRPVVRSVLNRAVWNRSAVLGSHDPAHVDPSPLARCAVAALFVAGEPRKAAALGADLARVTHQAPLLVDACRLYTTMVAIALDGGSREDVLDAPRLLEGAPLHADLAALVEDWRAPSTGRRRPPAGPVGALDRVVQSFRRGRDFQAGIERALLARSTDRDAEAAAYGALAGAFHGEAGIPAPLRARVAGATRLRALADRLHARHPGVRHGTVA